MKSTLETRVGLFFALALVVGAILLETIGGLDFFRRGRTVQARFNNVMELQVGDAVKMAGKQIGRVTDVQLADPKVLVVMRISDDTATIRDDSRATIKFSGLMGQNYVSIDFGSGRGTPIESGSELETYEQADLNALMARLEGATSGIQKLTDSFSDQNLGDVLLPFTDFLNESKPRLLNILTNAEHITAQVKSGEGTVGKLIYEETLHASVLDSITNLSAVADDVQVLVDDAKAVIADVRAGKGTVGKLATDEALYSEATVAVTNLREILQKINRGEGTVGKVVNETELIDNAKLTLQKLDKATEGLEDQGPLTVLGILVNPLF
jgi:phospholipid/cholesterol/gamma-HCH transport system substrate-binding protein